MLLFSSLRVESPVLKAPWCQCSSATVQRTTPPSWMQTVQWRACGPFSAPEVSPEESGTFFYLFWLSTVLSGMLCICQPSSDTLPVENGFHPFQSPSLVRPTLLLLAVGLHAAVEQLSVTLKFLTPIPISCLIKAPLSCRNSFSKFC